jgi:hypothetical protein
MKQFKTRFKQIDGLQKKGTRLFIYCDTTVYCEGG